MYCLQALLSYSWERVGFFCSCSSSHITFPTQALKTVVQNMFTRQALSACSCLLLCWCDGKAGTCSSGVSRSVCEGGLERGWGYVYLNALTSYVLHLAQLLLEEIAKSNTYGCQLQAKKSSTVTDMLGHLLSKSEVNILAQEPLLIIHIMIIHPRVDLVWKILFMGWIKKFPEDPKGFNIFLLAVLLLLSFASP